MSIGARQIVDRVVRIVDDVSVIAPSAHHPVGAAAPVERVVSVAADQDVVARHAAQAVASDAALEIVDQRVARSGETAASGEFQTFEVAEKGKSGQSRDDGVDTGVRVLPGKVGCIVDMIDVVTGATRHEIFGDAAVEDVVAQAAIEAVAT